MDARNPNTSQIDRGDREGGLPLSERYYAAAAIWLAVSMAVLDGAIVNIALPVMASELRTSPASAIWILNAYQLSITILLLPFAALGDRIGHRPVYLTALGLFVLGSLACASSGSLNGLIAARVLQGIGAAGIMSMNAALVRAIYPSEFLGRGVSYNAVVLSISAAAGPTLASMILGVANWHWIFAVNIPFGLGALILGRRYLPRVPGRGGKPDYLSAILSAGMMGLIVFGGETFSRQNYLSGVLMILVGLAMAAALIRRERERPTPLFPIDLLRIPVFSLSILTSFLSFSAQMVTFVAMPFFLHDVLGRTVWETGLLMTPWALAITCIAPFSGRLADKYNAGILGALGLGGLAVGLFALALLGSAPSSFDIIWRMALCGMGFGLFQSPNNRTIIAAAPQGRSGAAGGMLATARLLGQTTGAVVVASGFHWLGIGASPTLLGGAAVVATLAACISLTRVRFRVRT